MVLTAIPYIVAEQAIHFATFLCECKDPHLHCMAFPNFFFEELSGTTITFDSACEMAKNNFLNGPFFNDGNYLVNRNKYVETLSAYQKYHVAASDVIFANYLWLSAGGKLSVVSDSMYVHRVHEGSTWLQTSGESQKIAQPIKHAFRTKSLPRDGWMDRELDQTSKYHQEPASVSLHWNEINHVERRKGYCNLLALYNILIILFTFLQLF